MRLNANTSLLLAAGMALAVLGSGNARAATITTSGSSLLTNGSTLGPGNYGTVNYLFSGNTVSFDVQLNSGYQFLNTGFDATFAFTTNIAVVVGPTPPSLITGNAIGAWNGVGTGTGSSIGMNGAGNFGGGIDNSLLKGGSNLLGDDLKFTITGAAAISLVNAVNGGGHALTDFFAADICVLNAGSTTSCAGTGVVFDGPPIATPLPPAALLFGSALVGLGMLGRSRRKNAAA